MKKLWKKALKKTFGLKNGTTTYTVGQWLHNVHNDWKWFFDDRRENLFENVNGQWRLWRRITNKGRLGRSSRYKYHSNCISAPKNIKKATVQLLPHNQVKITGFASTMNDNNISFTRSVNPKQFPLNIEFNDLDINEFKAEYQ